MYSLNRAQIIGNLTRDPEIKVTPKGQSVASFAIATNRSWTNPDGTKQDAVEYHEIVAWGKLAEIAGQILTKGKQAYVEGRIQTRNWEGADGAKRNRTEVVAENLIALGSRAKDHESFTPSEHSEQSDTPDATEKPKKISDAKKESSEEINIDDIPF